MSWWSNNGLVILVVWVGALVERWSWCRKCLLRGGGTAGVLVVLLVETWWCTGGGLVVEE